MGLSRRALFQSLTIGGLYAWSARNAHAADATASLEAQLEGRVHEFELTNGAVRAGQGAATRGLAACKQEGVAAMASCLPCLQAGLRPRCGGGPQAVAWRFCGASLVRCRGTR
jgi:hypothetical protein